MKYVESLNQALHQLMQNDERIYLIGEDILDPYGGAFKVSKGLSTSFPERVITTPISESGITGFAIGSISVFVMCITVRAASALGLRSSFENRG